MQATAILDGRYTSENAGGPTAFYSPDEDGVYMMATEQGDPDGSVFFHEHGHVIDFRAGGHTRRQGYRGTPLSERTEYGFLEAVVEDVRSLEHRAIQEIRAERRLAPDAPIESDAVCERVASYVMPNDEAIEETRGIQDILVGVNRAYKDWVKYCHYEDADRPGRVYWERPHVLEYEVFANMYEAAFAPSRGEWMEKLLPTSWALFQRTLETLIH